MKRIINLIVFMILMLTFVNIPVAEASLCNLKTNIFFGNGMFNEQSSADSSLRILKRKMFEAGTLTDDQWAFELSYNHNEGTYSLFEVYRQAMGDQAASFWRWLGNTEVSPEWFQIATREIAATYDLAEALIDADLANHVQRYQGLLMEGSRVLVVAHSQGNLYANAAYTNLANSGKVAMDAFGIVSVATPASYVAGSGPYFTLSDDLVIASVRLAMPNTLPSNVTNTLPDSDWKHHSFIDSYLNGDQTGPLIVNSALASASALSWPEPKVGSGPISVTLTWGSQPDVDLHVYEPGGSHVYYNFMDGASGYLDLDDVKGWGPEHYYVTACDSLITGTYLVAVNYFKGSAPETAHVQIEAGKIVRDYSIYLPSALGMYGNYDTKSVASIRVIGDTETGYEFNVEGVQ